MQQNEYLVDLRDHRQRVSHYIKYVTTSLFGRANVHDLSRFDSPEYEAFESVYPKLKQLKHDSPELAELHQILQPVIDHHHKYNDHHIEHYLHGIEDMNIIQLTEMICDWIAGLDIIDILLEDGLVMATKQFNLDPQIVHIIRNTIVDIKANTFYVPIKPWVGIEG